MLSKILVVGVYLFCLLTLTPTVPFSLGVGGVLGFSWYSKTKWIFLLAFITGLLIDLDWGLHLGGSSLILILTALLGTLIHEHLPQWWMLLITALVWGMIWSGWFYQQLSWGAILGCAVNALLWYSLCWYLWGRHRGVYLKRGV